MAVLYITEYTQALNNGSGTVPVGLEPVNATQTLAISGSSAQSIALQGNTTLVRIHTDAVCGVAIGTNPTAVIASGTAGSRRMAANQTEYFGLPFGSSYKVAVISTT